MTHFNVLRREALPVVIGLLAICRPVSAQTGSGHLPSEKDVRALSNASIDGERKYKLGPLDQVTLFSWNVEEVDNKVFHIDSNGEINIPIAGRFQATGMTPAELEREIAKRVSPYVIEPRISVQVTTFASQPVSIIGAVGIPGVHQLKGHMTLVEAVSAAGGLRQDAGATLKITRQLKYGRIPLAGAKDEPSGSFSVAEVKLKSLIDASNPVENILVQPHDVISVPRAEMVYVVGEVTRAGGFVLNEHETLSVLQALSLAGGLTRQAVPGKARILRSETGKPDRVEMNVDIKRILAGKTKDLPLRPEDILFIPDSTSKRVAMRTLETTVQTLSGIVIWRGARF